MIIWYSANFMPVVKKQSHLCVTSIIITSGLFITMNNEHQLCLWQCSQFHKLILWKFWRTFVCMKFEVQRTDQTRAQVSKLFPSHGQTRCQSSLCSRHQDAGRDHVSRVTCPPRVGPHVTTLTIATSNIPPTRSGTGVRSSRGPSTPTSITSTHITNNGSSKRADD